MADLRDAQVGKVLESLVAAQDALQRAQRTCEELEALLRVRITHDWQIKVS